MCFDSDQEEDEKLDTLDEKNRLPISEFDADVPINPTDRHSLKIRKNFTSATVRNDTH